jgi:hypothetical protein
VRFFRLDEWRIAALLVVIAMIGIGVGRMASIG